MNLEGLAPTSDVSISINGTEMIVIRFASFQLFDANKKDLEAFESIGISFDATESWEAHKMIGSGSYIDNHDPVAIAERISMHYEGKGLRVRRLIADPKSVDRAPSLAIQSFILGG